MKPDPIERLIDELSDDSPILGLLDEEDIVELPDPDAEDKEGI